MIVNNSANINSDYSIKTIEHNTYCVGNSGLGLRKAQKSGGLLRWMRSQLLQLWLWDLQQQYRYEQPTIQFKNLHWFAFTHKYHTPSQKCWQYIHGQYKTIWALYLFTLVILYFCFAAWFSQNFFLYKWGVNWKQNKQKNFLYLIVN